MFSTLKKIICLIAYSAMCADPGVLAPRLLAMDTLICLILLIWALHCILSQVPLWGLIWLSPCNVFFSFWGEIDEISELWLISIVLKQSSVCSFPRRETYIILQQRKRAKFPVKSPSLAGNHVSLLLNVLIKKRKRKLTLRVLNEVAALCDKYAVTSMWRE